jgi:hypothetical protein
MTSVAETTETVAEAFRSLARRLHWAREDADWQAVGVVIREAVALGIDADALETESRRQED